MHTKYFLKTPSYKTEEDLIEVNGILPPLGTVVEFMDIAGIWTVSKINFGYLHSNGLKDMNGRRTTQNVTIIVEIT